MITGQTKHSSVIGCLFVGFICYGVPVTWYLVSVVGIGIGIGTSVGVVEDSIITTMSEAIHNRTNDTSSPKGTRQGKRQKTGFVIISIFLCIVVVGALLSESEIVGSFLVSNSTDRSPHHHHKYNNRIQNTHRYVPLQKVYLPLLAWEEESLREKRICQPPKGIPEYCCIGSKSAGGHVGFARDECNKGIEIYKKAEELALATLTKYPLPEIETADVQQQCDWCHIVDILIEKNWTLAFQGDSLTRQTFVGVECELRRRNLYNVTLIHTFEQKEKKPRWRYGMDQSYELHVSPIDEDRNTTTLTPQVSSAIIRYYAIYRPLEDMVDEKNMIMANNDILVFDHGLHYGSFEDGGAQFLSEMTTLVNALAGNTFLNETEDNLQPEVDVQRQSNGKSRLKIVAWRETTAQHYDTAGGDYHPDANFTYCAPIKMADWRRPLMDQILNITGVAFPQQFDILPFHEYTSHLHDLHSSNGDDCSHYCSTPSLWLPLWRTLRLAIDSALINGTDDHVQRHLFI